MLANTYNPRILVIDMNGNENFLPDVAIPVAASISFLCRASDVKKNEFVWTRAYFSSQDYKMVKQSQSVVIDSRDGEIVDFGGTNIKSSSLTKHLHNIPITHNVPHIQQYPTAFCKFQVGQNGVNYATVRWHGKGLSLHRDMFEITESKNSETGVIYSNLTMHVTPSTIRQELFGPYQCSFNIIPGSSVTQKVLFRNCHLFYPPPEGK
ncbi:hypothetical protein ACTXT7_000450 [Hymenolepis weldensis]